MSSSQHQPPTEYYSPDNLPPLNNTTMQAPQPYQSQTQGRQLQSYQDTAKQYQLNPTPYGQPFAPYQPSAQVLPPTRGEPPRNEAWEKVKMGFHAASIIICIVGLGMTFSLIGYKTIGLIALYCCPILIIPLFWSVAELTTRWLRRPNHNGIHPGAHVGVSLLTWMFASIIGGAQCTSAAVGVDNHDSECYNRHTHEYDLCAKSSAHKQAVFTAVAVTTCLVFVIHFTLFVGACVDTAKRNAFKRAQVMVVQQPYWGPVVQGWQPLPQSQSQEQPQGQVQNGQYVNVPQQDIHMQNTTPVPPNVAQGKGKERAVVPGQEMQESQGSREYYA